MALSGALPGASAGVAACLPAGPAVRGGAGTAVRVLREDVPAAVTGAANVMPVAYNPDGGTRVQLAWQRYSNSPRYRRGARPCVHPADSAAPARPAACR